MNKYENFWYKPEGKCFEGLDVAFKPANQKLFDDFEKHFGKDLPMKFKEIYKISNGGIAQKQEITINGEQYMLLEFLPLDEIVDYHNNSTSIPEDIIAIGQEFGSWIGLDYREDKQNPAMVYFDQFTNKIIKIGDSFDVLFAE